MNLTTTAGLTNGSSPLGITPENSQSPSVRIYALGSVPRGVRALTRPNVRLVGLRGSVQSHNPRESFF